MIFISIYFSNFGLNNQFYYIKNRKKLFNMFNKKQFIKILNLKFKKLQ